MTGPTLTIAISRGSLSLPDLVMSASEDGSTLGIVGYQEPAMQARVEYATSRNLHGSVPLRATWQQSILGIDLAPDAATEAELRAVLRELRDAVGQFTYTATVTINGAAPDVWICDMGSVTLPAGRELPDLIGHDPLISVTIPVYPIPGSA